MYYIYIYIPILSHINLHAVKHEFTCDNRTCTCKHMQTF